jgi:hypothetical protein
MTFLVTAVQTKTVFFYISIVYNLIQENLITAIEEEKIHLSDLDREIKR